MTSGELAFTKKPRRMTSPPQNERKWLVGYEGVEVVMETEPERIAYFAREATWGDIMAEPTPMELNDTLAEVATGRVLGAAFKGGYGFRIRASRSCMDQMLRLAEGTGGAGSGAGAQTTRDNDHRNFNIVIPNTIEELKYGAGPQDVPLGAWVPSLLHQAVEKHIEEARNLYGALIEVGVPPQDARYVALPLGFQTQWFHVMSLGNMIKMCEQRLCNGLTQHETNYLVRMMRDCVVHEHPWMADNLRSGCEKRGQCASSTMLFPPCGAFFKEEYRQWVRAQVDIDDRGETDDEVRLRITHYDPDKHLYPTEQNDAMQFAQWDIDRQKLERERPEAIFTMAGPPELIGFKVSGGGDG